MAWTQADLDALNKSIANGTLSVSYADRRVQYRTLDEMLKIRNLMTVELGLPGALKNEMRKLCYSKGIA